MDGSRTTLVACEAQDNARHGFVLFNVVKCIVSACDADSNGTTFGNGFRLDNCDYCIVGHCLAYNRSGTSPQAYGFEFANSPAGNRVEGIAQDNASGDRVGSTSGNTVSIFYVKATSAVGAMMRGFRGTGWLFMVATLACRDPHGISGADRLIVDIIASEAPNAVYATSPPTDPSRLVVIQQNGIVRLLREGILLEEPLLDIRSLVSDISDQGRGLLSLAFDPQYDQTRHVFVSYTDRNEDSQIDRFTVDMSGDRVDPASRSSVITVDQPIGDHNGGHILFGPDGHLYVALGDGGSGETRGNAQDVTSLVGSILRLDVRTLPYTIPANNPFHQQPPARPEIWAFGLRNPWRWSFDAATGDAYIADVGEHDWEEINVVPWQDGGGYNFGWSIVEGTHCFENPTCSTTGLVMPKVEYSHDQGCGVIGGFVYRGDAIPELRGHYLYSDFCESGVRSFRFVNNEVTDARTWTIHSDEEVVNVVSFGSYCQKLWIEDMKKAAYPSG